MALPARSNLFAVYNVKNVNGIGRWDHERQEAHRVQRLADVKASVQSRRPPRPQGHTQSQAATRATASSSSRKPVRSRSAQAQRSPPISEVEIAAMKYACRSSPDQLDAEIGNLLSLSKREMETQQYSTNADEAAAWKEEMKDWYFARHHNATALRELNVGGYGQGIKQPPELQKMEHVVKPRSVRSDRPELRRRSPYALDLRQRPQAMGRPRSVPADFLGGRCDSRPSTPSHPVPEKTEATPEAARVEGSRAEAPFVRSSSRPDVQSRSPSSLSKPDAQSTPSGVPSDVCDVRATTAKTSEKSPNLKSAAAIENWLTQANERLAEAFGNMPPVAAKEGEARVDTTLPNQETRQELVRPNSECGGDNRVDSLATTGTTVYEPTTRPASSAGSRTPAVGLSSKPLEPLDGRSSPGVFGAASLDMTYSQTELQTASHVAHAEADAGLKTSSPHKDTDTSAPTRPASLAPSKPLAMSADDGEGSDSEHFSEDGFEEEGDDPYAAESFNASAVSGVVMSDRGSSRSDESITDVPTRGICARAVEVVDEDDRSISSCSPKGHEESRQSRSLSRRDSRHASSASLVSCDEERRESSASSASVSPGRREELGESTSFNQGDKHNNTSNTAGYYDEEYEDFDGSDDDTSSVGT